MKNLKMIFFLLFLQMNFPIIWADEFVSAITRDGSFLQCQDRSIYYIPKALDRSIVTQWQQNDWLILQETNPHQIHVRNHDECIIAQRMDIRARKLNRITPYVYQEALGYEMILDDGTPWDVCSNYCNEIANWHPGDHLYIAEDSYGLYNYIINFNEGNYLPFYIGN